MNLRNIMLASVLILSPVGIASAHEATKASDWCGSNVKCYEELIKRYKFDYEVLKAAHKKCVKDNEFKYSDICSSEKFKVLKLKFSVLYLEEYIKYLNKGEQR